MDLTKAVIMSLLVLGVAVGEIHPFKICCPEKMDPACYNKCGRSDSCYLQTCQCYAVRYSYPCQLGYIEIIPRMSYYCKLGCTFSVCERITAGFKNVGFSGETEVKKAVQHCNSACSEMCNIKGSKLQLAAAA